VAETCWKDSQQEGLAGFEDQRGGILLPNTAAESDLLGDWPT
jgi:hypothetical protein